MRTFALNLAFPLITFGMCSVNAETFTLSSSDITDGQFMKSQHEFQGFGCNGDNQSPQLSWAGAPEDTEAFALMVFDPDAPTGSGWWHWQLINIPASVNSLPAGAGDPAKNVVPEGSVSIINDYGVKGFGGACPPQGHGAHRYQFTLYALSKKLTLPEGASGALAGYMVKAHSLGSTKIEALYERK
ncbi:YbhB/YbcL family Raf kinase inhibitor-like protein [Microbulbifer sp. HZ11]|uniref:YbhB/YbcL family Raf kinase inhibitor-like protein n=1 Tax=unclassified Microbulbifer TaxID=2619833 RepID=UPI0005B790E3|nr:YbhB/YbcL family Raf kinase inhibitor-like protein [Microbulbifer sp. HZ11]